MKTSDFSYDLPAELIAQNPLPDRTAARLMVVDRATGTLTHHHIRDLPNLLSPNDVLVFNETKVFPARLRGKIEGKPAEILLLNEQKSSTARGENSLWQCLVKPGKRFTPGTQFMAPSLVGIVQKIQPDGTRLLQFNASPESLQKIVDAFGEMPLPPYIKHSTSKPDQYQTVYAKHRGSVAAPTAGLHFTPELLQKLTEKGIQQEFVTLHVGRGTFEPVKTDDLESHVMHPEWFELTPKTAEALNHAKQQGKRIVAVGTTTTRVLETCAEESPGQTPDESLLQPQTGETRLFITPGSRFRFIDALLTNFHLPESTLIMLVSAFAGRDLTFRAYEEAIREQYRFYSFGDAMLIW